MAIRNIYTLEEYAQLKKKKKNGIETAIAYEDPEEIKSRSVITLEEHMKRSGISLDNLSGDIAPVRSLSESPKKEKEEEKEKESRLDFFQKGAFNDGYQVGDVTKTILGTAGDAGVGIVKGVLGLGEGIVDLGRYGVAGAAGALGANNYAEEVKKKAQKNSIEDLFKGTDDYLNQYSVLGRTSDAVMQGIGQVGGIIATGGIAGALGAGAGVATAVTTGAMGLSSAGSGMSEAYQGGATDKEAAMYGISKGIIDAGTELIFGGLGKAVNAIGLSKGISSLDDVFAQKLSSKISNQAAKNFVEFGVKASAEGFEEVLAGAGSAVAKKLTYMEEEELQDLLADENLLEQFVVGTVTSGMIQSGYIPGTSQGSLKESNKTERDFITGYTQNEQAIIDKEVEARTEGKNLTKKEIGKIEEEVKKDLEKGYISTDTIESTLGGDTYNAYNSLLEESKEFDTLYNMESGKLSRQQQNRLNELEEKNKLQPYQTELSSLKEKLSQEVKATTEKDTFLLESYNEKARRSQAYEADLTKYDEKQQAIIKNAAASGILNNTKRTHEFVDMIAKISADKGVSFDFTNNAKLKETGFAMEGKTVNGYIKDGKIAVNIDSNKALNTVVGHEITHVLEGSDLYAELQNVVKEYATTKGEYQTRYEALVNLYKDVDGAVIENELTADLVGEYLFTDSDFINNLSTNKPNVFKKIYEEIKYLYKLATAGSKEARELEKVKRAFDKAYKGSVTANTDTKYSLTNDSKGNELSDKQKEYFKDSKVVNDNGELTVVYHGTPKADFTVFNRNYNFFTDSEEMADSYAPTSEKFKGYLNIKNPYVIDAQGEKWSKIPIDEETIELLQNFGSSVFQEEGKWRTSTDDIIAAIEEGVEEGEFNYDGIIIKNVDDTGSYHKGKDNVIANDYIVFNSNQFKNIDNVNPTADPDIRYSLSEEGKVVDDKGNEVTLETSDAGSHNSLMAIHNLTSDKLNGILDLGGFPVPSIAIIDESNVGNLSYGDISVLLDKKSIDPADKKNEVYGSDVYSKRFPKTVQAVNEKALDKLQEYIGKSIDLEDTTLENAKSKFTYDQEFVNKFLQENNIQVEDVYKEVGYNYIAGNNENTRRFVIENDITFDKLLNNKDLRNEFYDLYRETMPSFSGFTEKKIARFEQAFNDGGQFADSVKSRMDKDFYSVKNGAEKVVDTLETNKAKRDKANNEYKDQYDRFLTDVLTPVFGEKYLRNKKDLYTPSGNRRSFKQLYDPYTLDNIMKNMLGKVQDNEGFFYGAGNIRSNVSKKFSSIADIKKNADKLISSEEFKQVKEEINNNLDSLTKEAQQFGGHSFDSYGEALNDVSKLKSISAAGAKKVFKEYGFNMPDSMIQKSINFLEELKNAPTEYFEAKPQRAIGFDEVQAVVIPNNTNTDLKKKLNDMGFYVVEYDSSIEGDRANKINQFDNLKFSLSSQKQDIAPVGNYRVYGKDIALEQPENAETITENIKNSEKISEIAPENTEFENYAPLTEEEANERDAMQGDRLYELNDYDMPEEVEAPYYGEPAEAAEPAEAVSPFEEKDIQEVGNRKQKAYMYENPEVKPFFQEEALVMLGELQRSVKGEKHFNDQLYYDTNGEQGWYGTKRETSEQIAYMLDRFKYTYADIEKGLNAIIEDHGAENNAISKRLEFMLDERLREGYTDFGSGYDIPANQDYINLLSEKQITEYTDEAYNRYLESLAYAEVPPEMTEAPMDEVQVLYSLETQQQEKIAEIDNVVDTEDAERPEELPTVESFDTKLENYKTAIEGYKNVKATMDAAFDEAINKKTAEYNGLKRKDTKRASDLLMQIENLKLRKSNNATKIDSKIAKVEATIDKLSNGIPTKRQIYHRNLVDKIKTAFSNKGLDFDKVLENAKNKGTFSSVDNTPQRFIEKSLGYKEGQILNDLTVNKVALNESKGIQWINSFTDKKDGLLAKISKEYGIKPRSKESAAAQMYAEGFWVDDNGNFIKYGDQELAKDFPNQKTRENIKKLAKDDRIRKIYDDTLNSINESRKRNLYPEIPRRKNYFLHFREMEDAFSKLGIPFNPNDIKLKDLPTDINGVTADLKPGQPYFASAKQRLGYKTTYDLIGGVERYLNSAKNQIYHIDDIQTLRALRNYIADIYGQAHGLEHLDSMTEEEAAARIEEVYNSHLSTFAKFLNEEANVIAGKTSLTDRGLEGVIGRRGIQFLDTVNRQVGSNMVGGNISSALTNTVSVVQAVAKSNKFDAIKAFAQTASNLLGSIVGKTDGFVDKNPMMIRRKGIERMTRTPWESITDKGYLLMGVIDNISSEFIARTKYNEFVRKGMSEEQAHIESDKWGSKLLGDRSLGQQPQLYNSKMLGLITKFQLEVRNQLDSQFYDTIQEAKLSNEEINNKLLRNAKTAAKVGSTFFQLAVLQHLFGKAFESVAGYNPTFDIVEALMQVFGFDDEEDSEDTVLDNVEEGFLTLLGDLPYSSTFTGGRIPISSALPVKQFITGKDSNGNEKSRWETIKETAPYYLAPTGYGQYKKTMQGLEMFNEEHPVAGSYTKSGNLRFPIEDTPVNRLQAGIFGQYANETARDYFDNERSPLKEKQIQEYKDLDLPIRDYWDYREGLSDQKTLEDKFDYIAGLDLPVEKKNIMINNIVDRKEAVDMTNYDDFGTLEEFDYATKNPEKYKFLQDNNISYQEYSGSKESKELYNWYYENPTNLTMSKVVTNDLKTYRSYTKELSKIKADKDASGKTISGSRKVKVLNYINGLSANFGEKAILFKKEYPSDDTYNNDIIEYLNGRNDISYEETTTILRELGFTVSGDGTVSW